MRPPASLLLLEKASKEMKNGTPSPCRSLPPVPEDGRVVRQPSGPEGSISGRPSRRSPQPSRSRADDLQGAKADIFPGNTIPALRRVRKAIRSERRRLGDAALLSGTGQVPASRAVA